MLYLPFLFTTPASISHPAPQGAIDSRTHDTATEQGLATMHTSTNEHRTQGPANQQGLAAWGRLRQQLASRGLHTLAGVVDRVIAKVAELLCKARNNRHGLIHIHNLARLCHRMPWL